MAKEEVGAKLTKEQTRNKKRRRLVLFLLSERNSFGRGTLARIRQGPRSQTRRYIGGGSGGAQIADGGDVCRVRK